MAASIDKAREDYTLEAARAALTHIESGDDRSHPQAAMPCGDRQLMVVYPDERGLRSDMEARSSARAAPKSQRDSARGAPQRTAASPG